MVSSSPSDCFFSIGSTYFSNVNISLSFTNNTADIGSTLFGGELNKCRVCYKTTTNIEHNGTGDCKYYSNNALETFMNFSSISLHKNSLDNISSLAQSLKLCQSDDQNNYCNEIFVDVYPGDEFNVALIALGQTSLAVPPKIVSYSNKEDSTYLSPKYQTIGDLCTNTTFRLYSANINNNRFLFDPELNLGLPCQNFEITLKVKVLPCPLGFALSREDKICTCEMYVLKFVQNCYIDSLSIERMQNNFWISKENDNTVVIHGFRCPLDYCTVIPVNVTIDKSYVQCDFNRTGTLCGRAIITTA